MRGGSRETRQKEDALADLLAYVLISTGEYHFDHVARLVSATLELTCTPEDLKKWEKEHPAAMKRAFQRIRLDLGQKVM